MPSGSTVAVVRNILKAEISESLTVGTANDALYNQKIANMQSFFVSEYGWSVLRDRWDAPIAANAQYTAFPTTDINGGVVSIDFNRPLSADVFYIGRYFALVEGIGGAQYNWVNPTLGQYLDPIQRWARKDNSPVPASFEVWPVPASGSNTVRFTGWRKPTAFTSPVADADIVCIDDLLCATTVAAGILAGRKSSNAQEVAGRASTLFRTLIGTDPHTLKVYNIGQDEEAGIHRKPIAISLVHS